MTKNMLTSFQNVFLHPVFKQTEYNICPSNRLSLNLKRIFDDDKLPPQKKILTAQTDNFEIPKGKLVASQVLSSGEWKFRVKPEILINKHQVGLPR